MIYSSYVNTLIQPISEENPVGEELSIEDDNFYWLDSEIRRTDSPIPMNLRGLETQPVDWTGIVGKCEELLEKKSKDLRLATYLCRGRFQLWEYHGLGEGLELCLALFQEERFKDTFYPREPEQRRSLLLALSTATARFVERRRAEESDATGKDLDDGKIKELLAKKERVDQCVELLSALNSIAEKQWGEPVLAALASAIGEIQMKVDRNAAPFLKEEKEEEEEEENTNGGVETEPEDQKGGEKHTEIERDRRPSKPKIVVDENYLDFIETVKRKFTENPVAALQRLGEAYENTWHPREKWILKFNLVQLCIRAERFLLAETLLKKLKAEIEPHKAWEPILYADLLVEEFGLQPRLNDDTTYKQDKPSETLYTALCESSLLKALAFDAARFQKK